MNADLNITSPPNFVHRIVSNTNVPTPKNGGIIKNVRHFRSPSTNPMSANRKIEKDTSFSLLSPHRAKKGMLNKSNINIKINGKYNIND